MSDSFDNAAVLARRVTTLLRGLVETLDEVDRRGLFFGNEEVDLQLFVVQSEARDVLNKIKEELHL
jgi:hypothetical protein